MKSKPFPYFVIILLLLSATCTETPPEQPTTDSAAVPTAETAVAETANLTVIFGYEGQADYVAAAQANPDGNLAQLHRQHVVEPYWPRCGEGSVFLNQFDQRVSTPVRDLERLADMTQTLATLDLETPIREAYATAQRHLPGRDTTICIFALDPADQFARDYLSGLSAFAAGDGKIWLWFDPEGGWEESLKAIVAHEYHHIVWTDQHYDANGAGSLVDILLFEGRADAFARQLYPNAPLPHTEALTEAEEERQWALIQENLRETAPGKNRAFLNGNGQDIPLWTGRTIAFNIMQAFLEKHPDVPVKEWTAMDAMQILEQSEYRTIP